MSVFFFGDPIPDGVLVLDQLGRPFTYTDGRFMYGHYTIRPADLEWPLTLETTDD